MKVTLVAPNDALNDPRAMVSRHYLERAGHEVSVVLPTPGVDLDGVYRAAGPRPGLVSRLARR
ncbi:MAG: hypothetical protein WA726_13225, partial [Acidimicrobiia bacterium]